MKDIGIKLGLFLLQVLVEVLAKVLFDKDSNTNLKKFVSDLEHSELTADQKYDEAKKYLDRVKDDVPDVIKNIIIEAAVLGLDKSKDKLFSKIK